MDETPIEIHLGVTFDQNYVTHFYALSASILSNIKSSKPVVHALITGLSNEQKDGLTRYYSAQGGEINFYLIDLSKVEGFVMTSSLTFATYYRLFFGALLPQKIERLLYIDIDTLVLQDITELYFSDLEGHIIGCVYDNYIKTQPLLGITEEGNYFNAGVMLKDLKRWRSENISQKVIDYLETYPHRIKFPDQCAMNGVFLGNWLHLPYTFNCMYSYIPEAMNRKERDDFIKEISIIHFTLQRPWSMLCRNRYRYLYFEYLAKTPVKQEHHYSDFSWSNAPKWAKLRIMELYFDNKWIRSIWSVFKRR